MPRHEIIMQNQAWINLLRRIPSEQQENLVLFTTIGMEVNIQRVVRLEEEYVVLRGRLGGTLETGRVFFIPYDQINYLGFQKEMKESEFLAFYGEADGSSAAVQAKPEAAAAPQPKTETPPEVRPETPAPTSPEPVKAAETPRPEDATSTVGKGTLLERLRARRQKAGPDRPPSDP
jgi:hypothetical protein